MLTQRRQENPGLGVQGGGRAGGDVHRVLLPLLKDLNPIASIWHAHTADAKETLAWVCRAADVLAETYTVCYTLSRKAFNELLGPIEDMWRFEALRKARPRLPLPLPAKHRTS